MPARILIVEDTPHNLELMRYLLEARGHSVVEATNRREGMSRVRGSKVDLIILDLQLGDSSGFDVLREMRLLPELAAVPVIAVTAYAMVGDRDQVLSSGFDGYIAKPLEPQAFAGQIESFLPEPLRGRDAPQTQKARTPQTDRGSENRRTANSQSLATILVVDDRRQNIELARGLLEPSGYEVLSAASVDAALNLLGKHCPHLVIWDIHFAEGNALDVLERVKDDPLINKVPFLFHSATASPEDLKRIEDLSGRFLPRPVDPTVLLQVVRAVIGEAALSGTGE